ncbi:hypothetical protein CU309_04960, partial [Prochlorococcus marinus str. MU1405]
YELTDDKGGYLDVSQTLKIDSVPDVPVNNAPTQTGLQVTLNDANAGDNYTVYKSDLLQGFTDPDGDPLSITNISTQFGEIDIYGYLPVSPTDSVLILTNTNGDYTFTPDPYILEGIDLDLTYTISDDKGGQIEAHQNLFVNPISWNVTWTATNNKIVEGGKIWNPSTNSYDPLSYINVHADINPGRKNGWDYFHWVINGKDESPYDASPGRSNMADTDIDSSSNWGSYAANSNYAEFGWDLSAMEDYLVEGVEEFKITIFADDERTIQIGEPFYFQVLDKSIDNSEGLIFPEYPFNRESNIQVSSLISEFTYPFLQSFDYLNLYSPNSEIKVYIHNAEEYAGTADIFGLDQNVNLIPHTEGESLFITEQFLDLDSNLSLDFAFSEQEAGSLIRIYKVSEDSNFYVGGSPILGLAYSPWDPDNSVINYGIFNGDERIDVMWQDLSAWNNYAVEDTYSEIYENRNIDINYGGISYGGLTEHEAHTIVHEIGHALGLDHPNGDPYGEISWNDSLDTIMSYNFEPENINYNLQTIPSIDAPSFSEIDIEALKYIWGSEEGGMWGSNNGYEYSLFTDIHDDGLINESIGNGGVIYADVIDELTGLAKSNHSHSHFGLSNQSAMRASNYNELDLETLSNTNPFTDDEIILDEFTECLNNSCLGTNQNNSLIDPITNFQNNESSIFDDNHTQNTFREENFI